MGYGWSHFVSYGLAVFFVAPHGITAVAVAAAVVHTAFVLVAYVLLMKDRRERRVGRIALALKELWNDIAPAAVACSVLAATAVPMRRTPSTNTLCST